MAAILKAVKKSPRAFGRSSGSSTKQRHEKWADKWGEEKEPVKEGVTFYLKLVGSTLVEELNEEGASYGDSISSVAVQTIVNMAKVSGKKKLPKVALTVSTRGIRLVSMATKEVLQDVTIYRICFCTADRVHDKIFAYVARNTENETMECHAFLCPKRKVAQAVTLTVAQAFNVAEEEWEEKEIKDRHNKNVRALSVQSSPQSSSSRSSGSDGTTGVASAEVGVMDLLGLGENVPEPANRQTPISDPLQSYTTPEVEMGFEDNFVEEDGFSSLAQSRSGRKAMPPPGSFVDSTNGLHGHEKPSSVNPFLGRRQLLTGLRAEDLDEGVEQLMYGQSNPDQLTRQPSVDDLLSL